MSAVAPGKVEAAINEYYNDLLHNDHRLGNLHIGIPKHNQAEAEGKREGKEAEP